jgi:peptidyl-prolyl cis-trans isomerase D
MLRCICSGEGLPAPHRLPATAYPYLFLTTHIRPDTAKIPTWKILDFCGAVGKTASLRGAAADSQNRITPMLDAMRRHVANILVKILLGLLVIAFAFWGIGDYNIFQGGGRSSAVATVGKTEISIDDFKRVYQEEMEQISRRLGRAATPEEAQLLGVVPRALLRLTGVTALDLHASNLGLTATNEIVGQFIKADNPSVIGIDGKTDMQKYVQVIRQSGYNSIQAYEEARRRDLVRQQLVETLGAWTLPQQFAIDALHRYRNETRVIEHLTPDFSKITVSEPSADRLKEHFEQSKGQYVALEERKANLLLVPRDAALSRVKIADDEVKAAYDRAKTSYDVPEKRRVAQLTFPDKAAAEKAYAELSKAKDFNEAAGKAGFPAADIDLGLLTKSQMIDPKIADAAFGLKKGELSKPVEGQFSVALLRVSEIEGGKQRSFDEVKAEIRDNIAAERVGQQLQALHDQIEAARAKGTPLKEIADTLKLPFQEIAAVNRTGKTEDGKAVIPHADGIKVVEAIFAATPGVETDILELTDGGYAWFDLLGITPQRPRAFDEVTAQVRTSLMEEERRKEIAGLVAKEIDGLKPGEGLERIAKALGGKIERSKPLKRVPEALPPGITAPLQQQAFAMAKGSVASMPTADGKSRTIFRVADIIPAQTPTPEEEAALKADVSRQLRIDLIDQYVAGLRTRYGYTVDEKKLVEAISPQSEATN